MLYDTSLTSKGQNLVFAYFNFLTYFAGNRLFNLNFNGFYRTLHTSLEIAGLIL